MNRARLILAGTLALLATLACGLLQTPSPETGEPAEGEQQATATPVTLEAASQESETTAESLATATPVPLPTEPPLISAWPLAADLFYLNDAGQIWRQPLAGDDSAAAAVTRLDLQILDFAVAPGGEWLLYRAGDHVAVTSVDGFSGQVIASELATPSAGDSQPVAWSPDATRLAYATPEGFQVFVPVPGAGSDFAIFDAQEAPLSGLGWSYQADWLLVWRTDGTAALYSVDEALSLRVELGRINGYAWLRDGRLSFAPAEGGLALLQPEDLNSRVFIVPQDRFVTLPVQRLDGTLAFFVHSGNPEEPGFLHTGDPLDFSFRPESNVPVRTEGMIWNPIGTRLLGRGESESATVLIIDPLTGSRATFDAAGVPLRFGWGDPLPLAVEGLRLP
ncbi:MAG TPA: hypothetical protein ENI95_11305, partial [Chloroflexi bacterium]|nr:hypothetical protein [Chloroflexota bacterium]